jgi:uncharacterized membrane protein YfcA
MFELVGFILLAILASLSSVSGGGSSGLKVSLIMLFFSFPSKEAVSLNNFSSSLLNLARYLFSWKEKHPEKDAILIDYNILFILMPTALLTSFVGAFVNVFMPPLICLVLLVIYLGYLQV